MKEIYSKAIAGNCIVYFSKCRWHLFLKPFCTGMVLELDFYCCQPPFILFSLLGFIIQVRGLQSVNTNAFIRSVYASLLVKIFIVIIALAVYLFITKGKINKPSVFTAMGLYILYTFIEVKQLMKISRRKTNA